MKYNIGKIYNSICDLLTLNKRINQIQIALGRIESRQIVALGNESTFNDREFKAFSQWGEDGIIQYLISIIPIENQIFVEFGVENYTESNTRFLLINNNWSGLVIDGAQKNINYIKNDSIYWRYNLNAVCAFIDKDNINSLIKNAGISGDIGLLSVDIDGNDYWVWEAIDVISPKIVICEYNSLFGPDKNVTIPYDPSFFRTDAHYSALYYGVSITAFTKLANKKGYSLVGSNNAGNNLFFVRNDCMQSLKEVTPNQVYIKSMFRESRDKEGKLTFLPFEKKLEVISNMPLVNLDDNKTYSIRELYDI